MPARKVTSLLPSVLEGVTGCADWSVASLELCSALRWKKIVQEAGSLLCCVDMSAAQNKIEFPALAIASS